PELQVEGLARPILLRRGRYFEALRRIWDETDTTPAGTLVCGDIFELDLALPAQLGARIHMLGREATPAYERDAVRAAGGSFSTALSGGLERIRKGLGRRRPWRAEQELIALAPPPAWRGRIGSRQVPPVAGAARGEGAANPRERGREHPVRG